MATVGVPCSAAQLRDSEALTNFLHHAEAPSSSRETKAAQRHWVKISEIRLRYVIRKEMRFDDSRSQLSSKLTSKLKQIPLILMHFRQSRCY